MNIFRLWIELWKADRRYSKARAKNEEWEYLFKVCMGYVAQGRECERSGDIDGALSSYWSAIEYAQQHPEHLGFQNYAHSLERVTILYRKKKEYEKEIAACDLYVSLAFWEKEKEKFRQRSEKARALLSREKNKSK